METDRTGPLGVGGGAGSSAAPERTMECGEQTGSDENERVVEDGVTATTNVLLLGAVSVCCAFVSCP